YSSFRDVPRWHRLAGPVARQLKRLHAEWLATSIPVVNSVIPSKVRGLATYARTLASAYLLRRCTFLPEELSSVMGRERASKGLRELEDRGLLVPKRETELSELAQISLWETKQFQGNQLLRDSDWASMSH